MPPVIKRRDILAFTFVVVQNSAKLKGRCLSLLLNEMYITLDTRALPSMLGVRDVVHAANRIQRDRLKIHVHEEDIDNKYWKTDKEDCPHAVDFAISRVSRER